MGKPIIEFKHFSYRYPNSEEIVLKDINLTIEEGDFVGIKILPKDIQLSKPAAKNE